MFDEKSVVCFYGDSITHEGLWIRRVYDYYINTLGVLCEMYNCGVAGDCAALGAKRMDETLFCHKPTDVVLMFGMNDIDRELYNGKETEGLILKRKAKIDECIENIEKIAERLKRENVSMIFCTPTPYDEISGSEETVCTGADAALCEVSERVRELSERYGGNIVDFNSEMREAQKEACRKGRSVIREDRVHPAAAGYELMAQIFLRAQGFDIPAKNDFSYLEKSAAFPYGEWEEKRFALEQEAKKTDFIEWCLYAGIKDRKTVLERMKKDLADEKNEYVLGCAAAYSDPDRDVSMLKRAVVNHTKTVHNLKKC